jgi:diacylglycerol O-acyltransferase / wax synthase
MSNTKGSRGNTTPKRPPAAYSNKLNESDSTLWSIERDPGLRTTIVAIALLDRAPDWPRLRNTLLSVSEDVPRLRQKVVEPPLRMGAPRWVEDPHFDVDFHLRRVEAPQPADFRTVLDLAGPIAMDAFDKDRPLWEFTLVEGLEGGRAAFIQKVHHSFTDGVGGMQMARLFLDEKRNARRRMPTSGATRASTELGTRPTGVGAVTDTISDNIRLAARLTRRTGQALPISPPPPHVTP